MNLSKPILNKPKWANFIALNKDGYYYWFFSKPKPSSVGWVCGGIKQRTQHKPIKTESWYEHVHRVASIP